jgi:hypothetical protein
MRHLSKAAAIHPDLVDAETFWLWTAIAENDPLGVERDVVTVEDTAGELRSDLAANLSTHKFPPQRLMCWKSS